MTSLWVYLLSLKTNHILKYLRHKTHLLIYANTCEKIWNIILPCVMGYSPMALSRRTNWIGAQQRQKTTMTTSTRRVTRLLFLSDSFATLLRSDTWFLKHSTFFSSVYKDPRQWDKDTLFRTTGYMDVIWGYDMFDEVTVLVLQFYFHNFRANEPCFAGFNSFHLTFEEK